MPLGSVTQPLSSLFSNKAWQHFSSLWENGAQLGCHYQGRIYSLWLKPLISSILSGIASWVFQLLKIKGGKEIGTDYFNNTSFVHFYFGKLVVYREKKKSSYRYWNFRPYSMCQVRGNLGIICSAIKYSFGSSRWISEVEKFFCLRWSYWLQTVRQENTIIKYSFKNISRTDLCQWIPFIAWVENSSSK